MEAENSRGFTLDGSNLGHVWYTVIGISIIRNKISCNVITITIYLFGDNTRIEPSIFYYNMFNIQLLLIIRALIILKHFGDLDFECYKIYMRVCVERGNLKKEKRKRKKK
jgi:hypothetical protein